MALLRLEPVEVVTAEALQLTLWGAVGAEERQRARRALTRVRIYWERSRYRWE
ncbi:nucleotidyltransferase/DNA polymerase involved in DNA repair [Mycobacteroides abscessus]|nr:nucleotidyltransferase/DNA polymerase involved in DNA repair [Mycobacteroides abscessus]